MPNITPPAAPVDVYESPRRRVQLQLMHVALAAGIVAATAWCYQVHIALGLTATFLAKHLLVALLAAAMRLPIKELRS